MSSPVVLQLRSSLLNLLKYNPARTRSSGLSESVIDLQHLVFPAMCSLHLSGVCLLQTDGVIITSVAAAIAGPQTGSCVSD